MKPVRSGVAIGRCERCFLSSTLITSPPFAIKIAIAGLAASGVPPLGAAWYLRRALMLYARSGRVLSRHNGNAELLEPFTIERRWLFYGRAGHADDRGSHCGRRASN